MSRSRLEAEAIKGEPLITIDPKRAFGRPSIVGTGIPVEAIESRFMAGDSVADLAVDFAVSAEKIEAAIRVGVKLRGWR